MISAGGPARLGTNIPASRDDFSMYVYRRHLLIYLHRWGVMASTFW